MSCGPPFLQDSWGGGGDLRGLRLQRKRRRTDRRGDVGLGEEKLTRRLWRGGGQARPAHTAVCKQWSPGRPEAPACGPWGWRGGLTSFPSTRRTPATPRCGSAYPVPEGILNPGLPAGPAQTPNVALSRTRVGFCLVASSGPEGKRGGHGMCVLALGASWCRVRFCFIPCREYVW